jgi:hypothetical protein
MSEVFRALARSPFVSGIARSLDLLGSRNQPSLYRDVPPAQADARAIASDWDAVGYDVAVASKRLAEEHADERVFA